MTVWSALPPVCFCDSLARYQFVAPKYMMSFDDDEEDETNKMFNLLNSSNTHVLRRSLDVLVMFPMLEQAPYARGFVASGIITKMSMFVREYVHP